MKPIAILIFSLAAATACAADLVLPPGAPLGDRTPLQLSVQWWQWAMMVPGEGSPVNDATGANCGAGQTGDVWFLAGSFKMGKVRRTCEVPAGKALFFPILQKGDRSRSCEEARRGAGLTSLSALDIWAELDGVLVSFPKRYRVTTQDCFDVYAKVSPMLGQHEAFPSASDGYWLLVAPLSTGRHVLKFGGRYNGLVPDTTRPEQDVEYELKVQ